MIDIYLLGIVFTICAGLFYARKVSAEEYSMDDCVAFVISAIFWPIVLFGIVAIVICSILSELFIQWLNKGK